MADPCLPLLQHLAAALRLLFWVQISAGLPKSCAARSQRLALRIARIAGGSLTTAW